MSSFKPDISQLFNQVFGFIPIQYKVPRPETSDRMSWMGTPVMFPMTFKGGPYNQYNPIGEIEAIVLNDFALPDTTVADFSRAKNITKTNVLGHSGTVKEIYGFDDWRIRLRGFCLDTPTVKAQDLKLELLKWEKIADSIDVLGSLFREKSIIKLCIEDIDFKQLQGQPNVYPFEIIASSDNDLLYEKP